MPTHSPENEPLELADKFFHAIEENNIAEVEHIYAPDALIWHNYDPLEARLASNLGQSVRENLALLTALPQLIKDLRYETWHQEETKKGFVRQHIVHGKSLDDEPVCFPVCVVAEVKDGQITKFYEYLDTAHLPQAILDYFAQQ